MTNKYIEYLTANKKEKLIDFPVWDADHKPILGQILVKELASSENERILRVAAEECDYSFREEKKVFTENSLVIVKRVEERLGNIAAKHFVAACTYDPETKQRLFATPNEAAMLTNSQLDYIYKQYYTLIEGSPNFTNFSNDELDKNLEMLATSAESGNRSFLSRCSPEALTQLVTFLAKELWNSKINNFLPSLLQDSSSSDTTNETSQKTE